MNKKDVIICRCEDVTLEDLHNVLEEGYTTFEEVKRILRVGMGPCGGKTCTDLIIGIFRELGIKPKDVQPPTIRPFNQEVPIKAFLKAGDEK